MPAPPLPDMVIKPRTALLVANFLAMTGVGWFGVAVPFLYGRQTILLSLVLVLASLAMLSVWIWLIRRRWFDLRIGPTGFAFGRRFYAWADAEPGFCLKEAKLPKHYHSVRMRQVRFGPGERRGIGHVYGMTPEALAKLLNEHLAAARGREATWRAAQNIAASGGDIEVTHA